MACGSMDMVSSEGSDSGFVRLKGEGNKKETEEGEAKMGDERARRMKERFKRSTPSSGTGTEYCNWRWLEKSQRRERNGVKK